MCLRLRFTLFFYFDNNNFTLLHLVWMSLSFNSLRSIMTIHYLCLYSVFKVHRLMSNNRNGTRKSSICFVTCFALCFTPTAATYKQAWRGVSCVETHCSLLAWRWWDSNSWPPACKAGALPTELHPHWLSPLFKKLSLFLALQSGSHLLSHAVSSIVPSAA